MRGNFKFASESVTEGHPDKICDQRADAVLDNSWCFLNSSSNSWELTFCPFKVNNSWVNSRGNPKV